jgi:two-component system KDP operon response regulator KdpE
MSSGARVVVVDDELEIRRLLQANLEGKGYEVICAESAEQALQAIVHRQPDVMVVDLRMPGMDGLELTRRIRQQSTVPIIVLSGIGDEQSKVEALELGADDYVTKPCGMEELLARVKAVLRRSAGAQSAEPVFMCSELSVNFDRREVRLAGNPVKLTPTEYDLLKYMIQNAGKILTHRMLLSTVWGPAYINQVQYLRVFVGQLRKKIEKNPARPRYIQTDPGVGYRFSMEASEESEVAAANPVLG